MVEGELKADTDAEEVAFFTMDSALEIDLAFDHREILQDVMKRLPLKR